MLADIGNGTMNVMYINDRRPQEKKCFTEKYGTHQCMLAVRENLLKLYGSTADEAIIDQVLRHGTASISERYLSAIQSTARDYVGGIFRRLREHEYDPELMKLYVVGGGGCLIKNFGEFDAGQVVINEDICATAKLVSDPYLETREKEDAFLLRVLETIRAGLNQSPPVNAADTLLRLLQGAQPQPIQVEEVPQEDQQEADEAVLDFVDSF